MKRKAGEGSTPNMAPNYRVGEGRGGCDGRAERRAEVLRQETTEGEVGVTLEQGLSAKQEVATEEWSALDT